MSDRPETDDQPIINAINDNGVSYTSKSATRRDEAREALEYIAHSGLSARHIEDYAKDFLSKK